jgi:DNA-binding Xre family transcriptional regulator
MTDREMTTMVTGTVRIMVPELLKRRGQSASDLMYGARIAQGTAYRLAAGEAEAISFDVLGSLCAYFGVPIGEVLVYVPEDGSKRKRGS